MSRKHPQFGNSRERGAAAILAMMFLVIFGSLSVAMAIVAQGNLTTAESHYRINRSLAAAETGMRYVMFRLNQATQNVTTTDGLIDGSNAGGLWDDTRAALLLAMAAEDHNIEEPAEVDSALFIGPIAVGPGEPTFEASLIPHPLAGEDYDSDYYQRAPYSDMEVPVSAAAPLDAAWIRVRVEATDGPGDRQITRSIQMDFRVDKKLPFAVLSKSRVMIGRNVMIDGPVGSRFMETWVENGHPIQMESDFRGLDTDASDGLDPKLDTFLADILIPNDVNGDNRINLANPAETPDDDLDDWTALDINSDGYLDEYDYFFDHFDANDDSQITLTELENKADSALEAAQLLELIDTFGSDSRYGHGDNVIDEHDRYAKIRGEVKIKATVEGWESGAAQNDDGSDGDYQNYVQGPIDPSYGESPMSFGVSDTGIVDIESADFDMSSFATAADGDLQTQAEAQELDHDPADPESPQPLGNLETEEVPYGAAYPYDYYDRPVYENMTFTDVTIPAGENALFRNCTFIGVTFIDTSIHNTDPNFNFAGMQEADGTQKYPDLVAVVDGVAVADTKTVANNVRFDHCTFEGAVVSEASPGFSHVRNKVAFTGTTRFNIDDSVNLTNTEKRLYRRSTILTPNYSVEMGTFINPADDTETVQLTGTIVAGVIDMRGQVEVNGTLMTTFEPVSGVAPVLGTTSPQFNTTLGYFSSSAGDVEAELPADGTGVIQITYDPDLALPDGINLPIQITPVVSTYFEGGG